jgi:hypothetical protein
MKADLHHREGRVDEEGSKEDKYEDGGSKVPVSFPKIWKVT